MMKFIHLVQNELTKQLKKVSVIVMIIILLVLSAAYPILKLIVQNISENQFYPAFSYYQNGELADGETYREIQEEMLKNSGLTDKEQALAQQLMDLDVDYYQMCQDYKIGYPDWRSEEMSTLRDTHMLAAVQKMLLDGESVEEIYRAVEGMNYTYSVDQSGTGDDTFLQEMAALPKEDLQKQYDENIQKVNEYYQAIVQNDYVGHLKKDLLPAANENITMLEEQLKQPGLEDTVKEQLNYQLTLIKTEREIIQYRIDHEVMYDPDDWRHNTLLSLYAQTANANESPVTQEEFWDQGYNYRYSSYEQYVESVEKSRKEAEDQIALCEYSLEKGTPMMENNDGTRNLLAGGLVFTLLVMVICIMVGGGIMSSEYSKGTVRLLMLRPVSRWKIIMSKFVCTLLFGLCCMAASGLVQAIAGGIIYGFSDLLTPVLMMMGGAVTEVPFILWYVAAGLFAGINVLFASCLAIALSTLFKNTALAVGLTIFATLSGSIVTAMAMDLGWSWIAYTIFPFYYMGGFVVSGASGMFGTALPISPIYGAILLSALSVICVIVTTIVFQKRDVKN